MNYKPISYTIFFCVVIHKYIQANGWIVGIQNMILAVNKKTALCSFEDTGRIGKTMVFVTACPWHLHNYCSIFQPLLGYPNPIFIFFYFIFLFLFFRWTPACLMQKQTGRVRVNQKSTPKSTVTLCPRLSFNPRLSPPRQIKGTGGDVRDEVLLGASVICHSAL